MHPPGVALRTEGMRYTKLIPAWIAWRSIFSTPAPLAGIPELIAQGDAFDAKLDNAHALESYLQAESLGAKDPDTYVRIARQYALLMNDTKSDDKQRELGEKALDYSKRARRDESAAREIPAERRHLLRPARALPERAHQGRVLAAHQGERGEGAEARSHRLLCAITCSARGTTSSHRWARSRAPS